MKAMKFYKYSIKQIVLIVDFNISLSVVDNPKSNISFSVIGEGLSEDIIFDELRDDEPDLYFKDTIVERQ